jgi:energy-coupling factor transporter ATP-binding protein EcfA2
MQNFELTLVSPVSTSFRAVKAANSLDIDAEKKSTHHFKVQADIQSTYNIGLIVGASGSGKTTLAKHIWGEKCFEELLQPDKPVIEQFPEEMTYDECAEMLCGVGLTSVPCWIRPAYTLSNGQKARAECALQMARKDNEIIVIDEWTSVVDRTVAKVMSYCIQKHARKTGKKIVLLSCHYDVLEWLNPDWVIDANKQTYTNRRLLRQSYERTEQLNFQIYETDRSAWKYFSRYHYLSESYPGGYTRTYGMFVDGNQIGFQCFANYVPHRKGTKMILHSNRVVIHPDYCGFGLGLRMTDACSEVLAQEGYEIYAKFSSVPMFNARKKSNKWKLMDVMRHHKIVVGGNMKRKEGFRKDVKTWSFKFVPNK